VIINWDNKPVAVWPLFLSVQNGAGNLNFLDNNVLPPAMAGNCKRSSEKQIIKGCFRFADTIVSSLGINSWSSMESFTGQLGLSLWHILGMGSGAKCMLNHEVFLDLTQEMAQMKAGFRKSYKSLINSGQKLWSVAVLDYGDKDIWNEFMGLHIRVAGRKTRSDSTWAIHYQDIENENSFLVYLRDKEGAMVGAGFFHFTRDEGLYVVGAYDRAHFDKPVGHVVQCRAIEELKKRNVRWYKLGARPYASQIPAPSDKEINIGDFKQGFSSHLFPRIVLQHVIAETQ
jgi:FemAB family protein